MYRNYDTLVNYKGVDEDPVAAAVIDGYLSKKYLKVFNNLEAVKLYVGGGPIVSKLGLVIKDKVNPTTGTVTNKFASFLTTNKAV